MERGSQLHIAAVRQCHEVIRANRPGRTATPPHLLCTLPYGRPCLSHKDVIGGVEPGPLKPCDKCAPHLEKVRRLLGAVAVAKSGYGGVNQEGHIVDRRDDPNAVPIAENGMLEIPKPLKP